MIIDLHELLQEDNGNRSYHLQLEADVFETSTASYKIKDYDLQLSFHNEGKKHISSRCEGFVVLEIPCDRCLEPVDYKIDIDYFKDLDMNKTAEEKIKFSEETSGKGGKVIWQIKITVQRRLICHQLRKSTLPN